MKKNALSNIYVYQHRGKQNISYGIQLVLSCLLLIYLLILNFVDVSSNEDIILAQSTSQTILNVSYPKPVNSTGNRFIVIGAGMHPHCCNGSTFQH